MAEHLLQLGLLAPSAAQIFRRVAQRLTRSFYMNNPKKGGLGKYGGAQPPPSTRQDIDGQLKELSGALEKIPYVGPILAYLVRHRYFAIVGIIVVLFLVVPLSTPILSALYLNALPEAVRLSYTSIITDAYSVDKSIEAKLEDMIAQNNTRLDFVQQFTKVWSNPTDLKSQYFYFPLIKGQEFAIDFRSETKAKPG